MSGLEEELRRTAADWERRGLSRRLELPSPERVDFASNDVLALAADPRVGAAAREAIARYGAGGRASRLLGGGSPLHEELEREAADWLGSEAALFFPSGTQANLSIVPALAGRGDVVFSDALNHASIIDACRLSRARIEVYPHLDLEALDRALARAQAARRRFVVTETIFSMEGDAAQTGELLEIAERRDAYLLLDEAHAGGLLGPEGAGLAAEAARGPLGHRIAARVVTGGKALGVAGALVAASRAVVDRLAHAGRGFVFTTAPPPAVAGALLEAIRIARSEADRRRRAREVARRLAARLGLPEPAAAIVPVVLGTNRRALEAQERCRAGGFEVRAVRPPTVPEGSARLRLVAHADHKDGDADRLAELLRPLLEASDEGQAAAVRPARDRADLLVVAGTDTGVGKTVVAAALLSALARSGRRPAYWKPVQTGEERDTLAVRLLSGLEEDAFEPEGARLPLPASPHEAAHAAGVSLDLDLLHRRLDELRAGHSGRALVLEPAGGLLVPWSDDLTFLDWIRGQGARFVLAARSGLGTLNHTLLSVEALERRRERLAAVVLVGPPHPSNLATLRRLLRPVPVLHMPPFDPLSRESVEAWLDENDLTRWVS